MAERAAPKKKTLIRADDQLESGGKWMKTILGFLKRETVLTVAWVLALASMVLVPPDGGYRN